MIVAVAGRNRARIVLTALQPLSVLIGQSTVGGFLALLGVVLSVTGPSNACFASLKDPR